MQADSSTPQRFHPAVEKQCPQCDKPFLAWESVLRLGWGQHCSRACFHASRAVPLEERFWPKVQRGTPEECWPWLGSLDGNGYGTFSLRKGESGSRGAHRMSWILTHGPINGRLLVRHQCGVTNCVNPSHLRLGTHSENMQDRLERGYPSDKSEPRKKPRPQRVPRQCLTCGKKFLAQPALVAKGMALYCRRACIRRPLADRFWEKVRKTESCWLWTGATTPFGYGVLALEPGRGKQTTTNRISWMLHHGDIPDGLHVLHFCDVAACVNPAHLFLGTLGDNNRDTVRKGRRGDTSCPGSKNGNAKLTEAAVREIRLRYAAGGISQFALAREYRVSPGLISMVVTHYAWKHLK